MFSLYSGKEKNVQVRKKLPDVYDEVFELW